MTERISIVAHANCDDAYVAWRYPKAIPDCRGFALYRKPKGGEEEPVHTFIPFAGEEHEPGEHRPSTEWPIQKFAWADVLARSGETVSYRVVPMVGKPGSLEEATDQASPWSDPVAVSADGGEGFFAYFNRGVLATQSVARRLKGDEPWGKQLRTMIATPGNITREYLSGELRLALRKVLADARSSPKAEVYAALFELDDPELVADLCALGPRAHVILANGADHKEDENKEARATLAAAKVDVHKRFTGSRLAHNKFLVVCEPATSPQLAWTGSTNWTMTGLCTQVNNGLRIENPEVAAYYKAEWDSLLEAGDEFPPKLVDGNGTIRLAPLDEGSIGTWFVPVHREVDLADARELIASAQRGILFEFFNPGREGTLFNAIMDRLAADEADSGDSLYVHGILNQDPEAGSKDPALVNLIHRGQLDEADPDIVLPSKIDARFASWEKEIDRLSLVMIHSKVVVLDPFGPKPVVMTGSHNLGPRASGKNDDNLNLIAGAPKLAAAYATHIISVYNAYRWRYVRSHAAKKAGREWEGPEDGKAWQDSYYKGADAAAKQGELAFWLGE
ncbi:MAG TPA: phospholipase D-like domain-containing protein [Solirubrobacterales bacterium]|jgi:phosphatidylserine/phosphatidylglycerophosphate/cardiolipin synthase-like enzyme